VLLQTVVVVVSLIIVDAIVAILNNNLYIILIEKSMKPLNLDNSPCSPTSSNCVIWQGPDLACIKLCKGDTVSDVVAKLAAELCTILDQLNVNNYDLTCFNSSACPPVDFQALIQFLIDHICALEGVTPNTNPATSTCPDCVVSIAPCFIIGTQTTMQLTDYVQMIGERVCDLVGTITNLQTQITNLDNRVTVLENTPTAVFTLPSIIVNCDLSSTVLGGSAYPIDTVLNALVNDPTNGYCSLIDSTGLPGDVLSAVSSQCITSTSPTLSNPPVPFGTEYLGTWVNTPTTVADAVTNLWIVICDMYDYLTNNELSVTDTTTVNLEYTSGTLTASVQDTGWKCLEGFNTFMGTGNSYIYPQVRRIGNQLFFKGDIMVPLIAGGGGVLAWTQSPGTNSYYGVNTIAPFTGTGGVKTNGAGSITFNWNAGTNTNLSVIPTSVIPAGYALDGSYIHPSGFKIATRPIDVGDASTILSTLFAITLDSAGILRCSLVKDAEEASVSESGNAYSSAHLNYLVSHVTLNEKVPQFAAGGTTVYSDPTAGVQSVDIDFSSSYVYPFSCDANDEEQIGGFRTALDGLTAFISPCGTIIPTPTSPCTGCATT
jgi:hypothetical protein